MVFNPVYIHECGAKIIDLSQTTLRPCLSLTECFSVQERRSNRFIAKSHEFENSLSTNSICFLYVICSARKQSTASRSSCLHLHGNCACNRDKRANTVCNCAGDTQPVLTMNAGNNNL